MSWLCRLFGHRMIHGGGPSVRHWCQRDCGWCLCKEHGCTDCHGRDYQPRPAYPWCVLRGGTGKRPQLSYAGRPAHVEVIDGKTVGMDRRTQ